MDWKRQCAAVIPCFNEAEHIADVVRAVRCRLPSVMVVDDGSVDGTAEKAAAAGGRVFRQPSNSGKGAALRLGWQQARESGFAWAMTMDGDGQHSADDIPAFLDCAEKTGAALVIGNRMARPQGMPWLRRQVNRWMSRRLSALAGIPLADSQCGFRLVNLEAWSRAALSTGRFEIESELIVAFAAAGGSVRFVPVQVIYRTERSKIDPLVDTWRWFRWLRAQRNARQPGGRTTESFGP